jgi:hypothetical protein
MARVSRPLVTVARAWVPPWGDHDIRHSRETLGAVMGRGVPPEEARQSVGAGERMTYR